jgi:hypothetical protein
MITFKQQTHKETNEKYYFVAFQSKINWGIVFLFYFFICKIDLPAITKSARDSNWNGVERGSEYFHGRRWLVLFAAAAFNQSFFFIIVKILNSSV